MCKKKKNYNLFFKKIIIKNNQIPNKALREIKGEKKKKREKGPISRNFLKPHDKPY
jgi:hypothetical protein